MDSCPVEVGTGLGATGDGGVTLDPKKRSLFGCVFTSAYGNTSDITSIVQQVSVYESIYNNCMFGEVIIKDGQGFSERQHIIGAGNETIHVTIETPGGKNESSLDKLFRVNSYSNAAYSTDGTGVITSHLGFVSPYLFVNNQTRIRRSFSSMTSSEIVDYVCYDILKLGQSFDIEYDDLVTNDPSAHLKNIVVPGWNPFKLLNFLCKNSVSMKGSANYMFFENSDGFHFNTVDALKAQEPTRVFTVGTNVTRNVEGDSNHISVRTNVTDSFANIRRFDHAQGQQGGLYGGRVYTHNILTKKFDNFEVEYSTDEVEMGDAGLNGDGQFPTTPDSHIGFMPAEYMYDIHDKSDKPLYPLRDMKMAELAANTVKFDIPGDSNVFAGDKIHIHVPTNMKGSDRTEDMFISGEWLVTAIHHKINQQEYVCTLECMKDSFNESPFE